jgi:hypothetical protein
MPCHQMRHSRHSPPSNQACSAPSRTTPGQRVARLARDQVGPGGPGPDPEELLRCDLVRDMPVRDATRGHGGEHLVGDTNIVLELHAPPVLGELRAAALHREWRVVVFPVAGEQGTEPGFVPVLPGCLLALYELLDVHGAPLVVELRPLAAQAGAAGSADSGAAARRPASASRAGRGRCVRRRCRRRARR